MPLCFCASYVCSAESAGSVTFKCSVPVGEYDGSFNEVHAILRRLREEHFQVSHLHFYMHCHTEHHIPLQLHSCSPYGAFDTAYYLLLSAVRTQCCKYIALNKAPHTATSAVGTTAWHIQLAP
jgi:hypothetical protein